MALTINDQLRKITSFPELVEYLTDELEWPIDADDFESYTFDWDAEEDLGVAPEHAVKIREIRQLRPLTDQQPWGIFFIEFEPKKLPIVVLRRLLNKLVSKKRDSANPEDRQTWDMDDLLFISSFGESTGTPELAFAHFHHEDGDLPTLRVRHWDKADTALKLDKLDRDLHHCLKWPEDEDDLEEWRKSWSGAFKHKVGHTIQTADMLAKVLAELAKNIRDNCAAAMACEPEDGALKNLFKAFQSALIHDLTAASFADTYAQTITYGLLTAAISRTDRSGGGGGTFVQADNLTDMVPITNPFLKEMLQSFLQAGGRHGGLDFDELGVQDLVEILRDDEQTDLDAVLRDFGNRNPDEDPVIRFYEHFLAAYNKELKVQRGVFYTPQPVVSCIVRSVHELLQTEFGLENGLASTVTWGEMIERNPDIKLPPLTNEPGEERTIDPNEFFVQILDPATGTGTFVVEVIDVIFNHLKAKWESGGAEAMPTISGFKFQVSSFESWWNDYVPAALLPRLYAYELLMAPYAIAHMKIGLKLHETGYRFESDERVRVYLTNALEPKRKQLPTIGFEALAREAAAVNEVKWYKRFSVIIGNPPYSKSSQNQGAWVDSIMEEYKRTVRTAETQIQALSDDYSKFIRLAHFTLEPSGLGVIGYITNNGWLDGPLFRDMRSSLSDYFQSISLLNLHGDSRKQFLPPDGKADENVFEIQQGVAIGVFSRSLLQQPQSSVEYYELWGTREERYCALSNGSQLKSSFMSLQPTTPFHLFIPVEKDLEAEFSEGWHLYDVFGTGNKAADNHVSYGAGFVTQQDQFAVSLSDDGVAANVAEFLNPNAGDKALWERFQFCSTNQWDFKRAKRELKGLDIQNLTRRCLYRPFDFRFTIFNRNICTIIRKRITMQFSHQNVGLLTTRRVTRLPYNNVFACNTFAEYKVASHDRNTIIFPLWIYSDDDVTDPGLFDEKCRLNLNPEFLSSFAQALEVQQEGAYNLPANMTPEDIFHYIYGILHSPSYRNRYAEFLKIDFPRLPLPSSRELFRALAALGEQLVALHLMESPELDNAITDFVGDNREVKKIGWTEDDGGTVWLDGTGSKASFSAGTSGFVGVPSEVWNFHIGG